LSRQGNGIRARGRESVIGREERFLPYSCDVNLGVFGPLM